MKKTIIIILICLVLIQSVSAYTYLNIYLDENGEALFLGETNEKLSLPEGIEIKGKDIVGRTQTLTNKQGELWGFSYLLEGAEMNILLPKGAVIKNIEGGEISINNKQISIYIKNEIKLSYILNGEEKLNYWLFLIIIPLIILGLYFYKLKRKFSSSKPEQDKLEIIKQTLSERENKIIDKLKEVGEIKNSKLQKILEIPKASFSRHIQELEKKEIIERKGEGKNKLISLR